MPGNDGLLQHTKFFFLACQVFIVMTLDQQCRLHAVVKNVLQKFIIQSREQATDTGQTCKPLDIFRREFA